jgi:hypothetical protein
MELTLNLVWVVLVTLMLWLWMHHAPREGASRRTQIVALAVIVLILFPVVSVTDDLMAVQNPAETESCQRRSQMCSDGCSTHSAVAVLALPAFVEPPPGSICIAMLSDLPVPLVAVPAVVSIQNRPPPAA